jgi:nitroimidazol reductase NimA-like FMN-containing flavoprotein (pyridoxamine 5'-phosphate oxidase superfamily)
VSKSPRRRAIGPWAGWKGAVEAGDVNSETTFDALAENPELLREIEPSRCLHLLESVSYGRLATVDAGEPVLVVVNHIVDAGDIYLRTRPEARLARLTEGGRVANAVFEVDSAHAAGQSAWSVMARGRLSREHGEKRSAGLRSRLTAWAQGERDVVLHLQVQELTGRAVGTP